MADQLNSSDNSLTLNTANGPPINRLSAALLWLSPLALLPRLPLLRRTTGRRP
jgi:hypothetical protein